MRLFLILFLGLFGGFLSWGQTANPASRPKSAPATPSFRLLARYTGDSVTLRWFPADPLTWKAVNQTGYVVVRYGLNLKTRLYTDSVVLTPRPLKPLTAADWKNRFPANDTVAKAFGRLATDENPAPVKSLGDALHRKDLADQRFVFTMLYGSLYPAYLSHLALRFTDKTALKNKTYVYQLRPAPGRLLVPVEAVGVVVTTEKPSEKPEMPAIVTQPGDRVVHFTWDRKAGNYWFLAYVYERSADGGKTFARVRQRPYIDGNRDSTTITLIDTLPRNYVSYQYRIAGITAFGDPGQFSPAIAVMGRDLTPPNAPTGFQATNTSGSAVQLSWAKPVKERDLTGFLVSKSPEQAGPFVPLNQKLLPPETTQFTDPSGNQYAKNFYVVSAVDTAGNASASLAAYVAMRDPSAPAQPVGLTGSIDTTGRVTINWKRNSEPDLLGYLVYVANSPDHAFTPVTPDFLTTETHRDSISLRTLSEKIYYRVVAFDKSRRASPYSETLELKKPDRVPPISPVFDRFLVADSSVTLHWARSSSEDVVSQILYRKPEGKDGNWQELARLDTQKNDFIDQTVTPRKGYQYVLVAVDDSKNKSEFSFPQRVRTYDSSVRKGIQNLTVTTADGQPIQLAWKSTQPDSRVLIYRIYNEQGLRLIENLPGTQQTYADSSTPKGVYQYAIKVMYGDGGESPLSGFVKATR